LTFKVIVHKAEEGGYWAEVPELPGCATQGETMDDVLANIREAATAYLRDDDGERGAGVPVGNR
jgi:predicted RNase H-like HicB family nuclease